MPIQSWFPIFLNNTNKLNKKPNEHALKKDLLNFFKFHDVKKKFKDLWKILKKKWMANL